MGLPEMCLAFSDVQAEVYPRKQNFPPAFFTHSLSCLVYMQPILWAGPFGQIPNYFSEFSKKAGVYIFLKMSLLVQLLMTLQPFLLHSLPDGLHTTPPMGWSSWNTFFSYNSEEKMMAQVHRPCPKRSLKIEVQKLHRRKFHSLHQFRVFSICCCKYLLFIDLYSSY